jgi:hypothetical protein
MRQVRISLIWFLLFIGLIGSGVGMYARYYIASRVSYVAYRRQLGRNTVYAAWVEDGFGRQQLKYFVITPRGDQSVANIGAERTSKRMQEHVLKDGLSLAQTRLYFQGILVPHSEDGRVWIYRTTTQSLEKI